MSIVKEITSINSHTSLYKIIAKINKIINRVYDDNLSKF